MNLHAELKDAPYGPLGQGAGFIPPGPERRVYDPNRRMGPLSYVRYLRTVARNPLETWTEKNFEEPVFRFQMFGRHHVIVSDPAAIQHVFIANAENYRLNDVRQKLLGPLTRDGLLTAEGPLWKRTRKLLTPVFNARHIERFAGRMKMVCEQYTDKIVARDQDVVQAAPEMVSLTLEILLETLFSGDAALDPHRFSVCAEELIRVAGIPHPFDLMGAPDFLPRIGKLRALTRVDDMRAQVQAMIDRRRSTKRNMEDPDFLDLLLSAGDGENTIDGEPLSDREILDNVVSFLLAGHETTARSLAWALFSLSQQPEVRETVEREVREAPLDDISPAQWEEQLPFMVSVLKETMRLYPPAPHLSRTAISDDVNEIIAIEKDTQVHLSTWVLHRHKTLWERPDEFVPDRFLGENANRIARFTYLPFGIGPRVCIGARFAQMELTIAMACLLRRLRFDHVGATPPMPMMRVTLQPSTSIPMRVEKL